MRVDILIKHGKQSSFYGSIDVKCLKKNSPFIVDNDELKIEVETRLPYLKGKQYLIEI